MTVQMFESMSDKVCTVRTWIDGYYSKKLINISLVYSSCQPHHTDKQMKANKRR